MFIFRGKTVWENAKRRKESPNRPGVQLTRVNWVLMPPSLALSAHIPMLMGVTITVITDITNRVKI